MKKIFYLIMAACALFLTGCKDSAWYDTGSGTYFNLNQITRISTDVEINLCGYDVLNGRLTSDSYSEAKKRIEKIFEAMKKNPPHKDNIGIVCRCILQLDNHKIELANAKRELKAIDDLKKYALESIEEWQDTLDDVESKMR